MSETSDHVTEPGSSPPPAAAQVFGERLDLARRYREVLATDGVEMGLIGPREIHRLWDRHIINCAVIGEQIAEGEAVIDVGSGAGLPGVALAIARPDLSVTLLEPLLRRSEFLTRVVADLGLDTTVIRGRAEERSVLVSLDLADVVTSRAVAPLDRLARWSAPLVRAGGRMIAIKGASAADEIDQHRVAVNRAGLSDLRIELLGEPILDTPTTVVIAERTSVRVRRAPKSSARTGSGSKLRASKQSKKHRHEEG